MTSKPVLAPTLRVKLQRNEVAPTRLQVRQVHSQPGPSPLCAVHSVKEAIVGSEEDNALAFCHLFASATAEEDDEVETDISGWTSFEGAPFVTLPVLKSVAVTHSVVTDQTKSIPSAALVLGSSSTCALSFEHLFSSPLPRDQDIPEDDEDDVEPDTSGWIALCDGAHPFLAIPDLKRVPVSHPGLIDQTMSISLSTHALVLGCSSPARARSPIKTTGSVNIISGKENERLGTLIPRRAVFRIG